MVQRNYIFDMVKGFGIMLVILGHLVDFGGVVFNAIFAFHMPLFFLVSGYFLKTKISAKELFLKQVRVLLIPYLIVLLIGLCVCLIIPSFRPHSILKVLYESLYLGQPELLMVGQIWFLVALAVAQWLYWALSRMTKKWSVGAVYVLYLVCIPLLVWCIDLYGSGYLWLIPLKIPSAIAALPFVFLGQCLLKWDVVAKISAMKRQLVFWLFVGFGAISIVTGPLLNHTVNICVPVVNNPLFWLVASVSGIMATICLSIVVGNIKAIAFYGRNSLSIFALHSFFLYAFAAALSLTMGIHFVIMQNIPYLWSIVGAFLIMLVMIPIPYLYDKTILFIERLIQDSRR